MKNYLNDDLSEEERTEIIGIIWMTVKNYKFKQYAKQRFETPLIEDLDLQYYDSYDFEKFNFKDYYDPLTKDEKIDIINKLDSIIDKLFLFQLKRTLTFNEKLVFFFAFINKYTNTKISFLLSLDRKTIYNCKKSIKNKIEERYNEK